MTSQKMSLTHTVTPEQVRHLANDYLFTHIYLNHIFVRLISGGQSTTYSHTLYHTFKYVHKLSRLKTFMRQPQELSSKVIDLETVPYLQSSSSTTTTTTEEEEEEDPSMPSKPRESESVEMTAVHHESCGVEHLDNGSNSCR